MDQDPISLWLERNWPILAGVLCIGAFSVWGHDPGPMASSSRTLLFHIISVGVWFMPIGILALALYQRARTSRHDGLTMLPWSTESKRQFRLGFTLLAAGYALAFASVVLHAAL